MKHLLLTTIAAVLLVGCGEAQPPEPPDILITEAVFDGNIGAVKQHIAAGTDVNVRGSGVTPLHHAATQDHKKIAELLIAKGADVNAKFTKGPLQGWAPLDFATLSAAGNNKEIADLLRKHGGKHGTIYVAAQGGDIEAVKEFLASGTDVNVKDEDGDTPLLEASGGGHKEVVELLIAAGADVNAKSVYGITPFALCGSS